MLIGTEDRKEPLLLVFSFHCLEFFANAKGADLVRIRFFYVRHVEFSSVSAFQL